MIPWLPGAQRDAGYLADVRLLNDLGRIVRTAKPLLELDGH